MSAEEVKTKTLELWKNKLVNSCTTCSKEKNFVCEECSRKFRLYLHYMEANIPSEYWELKIQDFNRYPSTDKEEKLKREELANKIEKYTKYTELDEARRVGMGLVFYGKHGVGKSLMANYILKRAIQRGYTAINRTMEEMIRNTMVEEDRREFDPYYELKSYDFFLIEDIGWEYQKEGSDFVPKKLDSFYSIRKKLCLPTIITFNLELQDFLNSYTQHLDSLIRGSTVPLLFAGTQDFRKTHLSKRWRDIFNTGEIKSDANQQ